MRNEKEKEKKRCKMSDLKVILFHHFNEFVDVGSRNSLGVQCEPQLPFIKVLEGAAVMFCRTNIAHDNLEARIGRVIRSLAFLSIVVSNVVCIQLFEFVNAHHLTEFASPERQRIFQSQSNSLFLSQKEKISIQMKRNEFWFFLFFVL
jgi:hypothetical protein